MGVIRGPIKALEYTTLADNYDPTDHATTEGTATWTDIPVRQLLQQNSEMPREVSTMVGLLDGAEGSADKRNSFAFACAPKEEDTFLDGLKTAETNLDGVWFRVTPSQGGAKVIGGANGCVVSVDEAAIPALGDLETAIVRGSVGGAIAGDTIVDSVVVT